MPNFDGEFWGWPDFEPLPELKDPPDPPTPPPTSPKPPQARLYPPEDQPPDSNDDGYLTGWDNRWD